MTAIKEPREGERITDSLVIAALAQNTWLHSYFIRGCSDSDRLLASTNTGNFCRWRMIPRISPYWISILLKVMKQRERKGDQTSVAYIAFSDCHTHICIRTVYMYMYLSSTFIILRSCTIHISFTVWPASRPQYSRNTSLTWGEVPGVGVRILCSKTSKLCYAW